MRCAPVPVHPLSQIEPPRSSIFTTFTTATAAVTVTVTAAVTVDDRLLVLKHARRPRLEDGLTARAADHEALVDVFRVLRWYHKAGVAVVKCEHTHDTVHSTMVDSIWRWTGGDSRESERYAEKHTWDMMIVVQEVTHQSSVFISSRVD